MLYKPVGSVEKDPAAYLAGLADEVVLNQSLAYVGAVCASINLPLLFVFLTYPSFRGRFQMLITLACADFVNCLGMMVQGIQRFYGEWCKKLQKAHLLNESPFLSVSFCNVFILQSSIFIDVIASGMMPVKSPFDCVGEAWLVLREVGGLWAPMIQIIMGSERMLAVFKPAWYNRTYTMRSVSSVLFSIFFVVVSIAAAILIAWTQRESKIRYYCGRKSAFTANYGTYVYIVNVCGYAIGLLLNLISYCKVRTFMSKTEKNKNLARLRYYLVISVMSTVLVSIPNFINLASVLFDRIADEIQTASNWATCINSGMNFFVYLVLNEDFRNRCKQLVNSVMGKDSKRKASVMDAPTMMGAQAKVSTITVKTLV